MSRPIRFNLLLDGRPVRDLDGLRANFNLSDLLAHHQSGLLQRWLEVRGYPDLARQVAEIRATTDLEVMIRLAAIFEVEADLDELRETLHLLRFDEERRKSLASLAEGEEMAAKIIAEYHGGYERLKSAMLANRHDFLFLKRGVADLAARYGALLALERHDFFDHFLSKVPLVVFLLLATPSLRPILLDDPRIHERLSSLIRPRAQVIQDIFKGYQKTKSVADAFVPFVGFFQQFTDHRWVDVTEEKVLILSITQSARVTGRNDPPPVKTPRKAPPSPIGKVFYGLKYYSDSDYAHVRYLKLDALNRFLGKDLDELDLGGRLRTFQEDTKDRWREVCPHDVQVMVISAQEGIQIRSAGSIGEALPPERINGTFPLLDGLECRTRSTEPVLHFMEFP
ncbi:MAG: hypothetical protein D6812_08265 [Deltaproteobacteria bacterium]|nr:MAG: hypothetical protein D6812_08265 [Deltaproteobacteria bacterium]